MRPEKIIVVGFGWAGYGFLQTIDDYAFQVYSSKLSKFEKKNMKG